MLVIRSLQQTPCLRLTIKMTQCVLKSAYYCSIVTSRSASCLDAADLIGQPITCLALIGRKPASSVFFIRD